MNEPIWEDPPEPQSVGRGKWVRILEPLKDRPDTWARVHPYSDLGKARSAAKNLADAARPHTKSTLRVPPGRWEFVVSRTPGQLTEWAVYARYLGPTQPDAAATVIGISPPTPGYGPSPCEANPNSP